jgi:hemoglobin/transferrin/lactoferrin receptor protein
MCRFHSAQAKGQLILNTLAGAITAALWLPAQAQQPTIESPEGLETLHVTAHRSERDINDIAASVGVISKELLDKLQPYTLADLFRYEPGVQVEKSGDRHGDASINIRGIGGNRVVILQDGARMPSGFGSAGVDQGRGSFNAFNLERVELLKGPSSALYGSDAIGGVVLLETLDPERLATSSGSTSHSRIGAGYASVDERYHTSFVAASKLGAGYGLIQLDHQGFSERDINSRFDPNPKDGDVNSVLAKWSFDSETLGHWDFIGDYWKQDVDNTLNTNIGPVAGPPGTAITSSVASDESHRWHLGVHNTLQQTLGLDLLHWQLDYQESDYEQREDELQQNPGSNFPPIPASAQRTLEHEQFEQQQWSFSLRGERQWGDHTTVAGVDLLHKSFTRPVDRTIVDEINGTVSKSGAGVTYPGKSFPDTDIEQWGLYLQDQWVLSDKLDLIMGIRYDSFRSSPNADAAYDNFNPSGTDVESRSDDRWSPNVGMTYQLTREQQLYASYQTGFRAPPVDDQFISRAILIPVPGVPHEVLPNSDLGPETSKGFELGWRWNSRVLSASLAHYRTTYEDFIDSRTIGYRELAPIFVGPTAIRQIQYMNVDEVEIKGFEFKSRLHLNQWLQLPWQAHLNLTANVIEAENEDTGLGLNSVGPDTLTFGLDLNNPDATLGISWYLRAVASADDAEPLVQRGQPLPAFEPPGYSVHDLTLVWSPNPKLRVDATVYNLFDKKFWGAHAKGDNANGDLDAKAQPGRNFSVNLSYSF